MSAVDTLHLIEADHAACDCARQNVSDARLQIHWEDATRWQPPQRMDAVISNPPFHTDRAADPNLGRAFIANAARLLRRSGAMWMVANRHLPYEPALARHFDVTETVTQTNSFKVIRASRPRR